MKAEKNISHLHMLHRKENVKDHLNFHDGDVPYFTIPVFDALGLKNGFTTKFGGISTGYYAEMNMAALKEPEEIIQENYRRICQKLQMDEKKAVLSYQTHTVNVRVVTEEDFGKGPFKLRDYTDTDGLVTNLPGVPLVTLYADCVPLYFYDPVKKAIGLSHAGWRGTVHRMAESTVRKMRSVFGTDPGDVVAAIGPSICRDCYEVGPEVAAEFIQAFGEAHKAELMDEKPDGKFQLDLWAANRLVMKECGIPENQIFVTDICTKCCGDLLYSHRVMGKQRGLLAALLSL